MELGEQQSELARRVYPERTEIELVFNRLSCCSGGLGPLPAWVRRRDRVTRWATAKITACIHACPIVREQHQVAA